MDLSRNCIYAPETAANPRIPNGDALFFVCDGTGWVDAKTLWEVVAGKRMRLKCCTVRWMTRALAVAEVREGIIRFGQKSWFLVRG